MSSQFLLIAIIIRLDKQKVIVGQVLEKGLAKCYSTQLLFSEEQIFKINVNYVISQPTVVQR